MSEDLGSFTDTTSLSDSGLSGHAKEPVAEVPEKIENGSVPRDLRSKPQSSESVKGIMPQVEVTMLWYANACSLGSELDELMARAHGSVVVAIAETQLKKD